MTPSYQRYDEHELSPITPIPISLPDGRLNSACCGWSRQPVQVSNLRGFWPRKKRWNYWCVVGPDFLFSVTLSNIDYMGLAFAYYLDFNTLQFIEKTVMTPFGKGCRLPETVAGRIDFRHKEMNLTFVDQGAQVEIEVHSPDFNGVPLDAQLRLQRPDNLESLNVVIPWSADRYHFTSKQNCLPASGALRIGPKTLTLDPQRDFGCLDLGRGIWKYRSFWNWSSFSTRVGSDYIGANLGAGWTDGSGTSENALLIAGRLERLDEDVIFEYDPQQFMKPWRLKTAFSNQVDLTFTPFFERVARTDLYILRSEVHQMIGKFSGTLTAADGRAYPIAGVTGWAEEHQARW